MPKLLNRQKQVPNGMSFYCPILKYKSPPWASFQTICDGYRVAIIGNPGLAKARGLSSDPNWIADTVDTYIATNLAALGHNDFITGGSGVPQVPFQQPQIRPPSPARKIANLAVGAVVNIEWIASGSEAVPQEQANRRAEICSRCPKNPPEESGWEKWFSIPAANAIRLAIEKKNDFKLVTPFDASLKVCNACDCPLILKVWTPFDKFFHKMPQDQKDALNKENPMCWIIEESPK